MFKRKIFGVEVPTLTKNEITKKITQALEIKSGFFLVTLNPEILLLAKENANYKEIINSCDLTIIDGIGIYFLAKLKGFQVGERWSGADLAEYIIKRVLNKNLKIGLVLRSGGYSNVKDLENWIMLNHPKQKHLFEIYSVDIEKQATEIKLNNQLEILLVGLGAPFQEEFIAQQKKLLPNLRVAIGVGGTFDFWTKKKCRAPKFLRNLGLEWLWRLAVHPNRFFRIWRATAVFTYQALKD